MIPSPDIQIKFTRTKLNYNLELFFFLFFISLATWLHPVQTKAGVPHRHRLCQNLEKTLFTSVYRYG